MCCIYWRFTNQTPKMCAIHTRTRTQMFFVTLLMFVLLLTYIQWKSLDAQQRRYFTSRLGFKDTVIPGWEATKLFPTAYYVFPGKITAILSGKNTCIGEPHQKAVVVVCSEAQNYEQRVAIRNTWALDSIRNYGISVVFLTGLSEHEEVNVRVTNENQAYNDVIVENFFDTPQNGTLKSVMMLKWISETCHSMKWVLKTSDDVFINIPNLAKFINDPSLPQNNALFGALRSKEPVERDSNSDRFMPKYMYPYEVYPDYLGGAGYLMSVDVAKAMYDKALKTSYVYLEDVFVTGLCAEAANIKRSYDFRFYYIEGSQRKFDCSILYQKNLIVHSRNLDSFLMFENYDEYRKCFS